MTGGDPWADETELEDGEIAFRSLFASRTDVEMKAAEPAAEPVEERGARPRSDRQRYGLDLHATAEVLHGCGPSSAGKQDHSRLKSMKDGAKTGPKRPRHSDGRGPTQFPTGGSYRRGGAGRG